MSKSISFSTEIPASRELRITLPDDVPTGTASIVITISRPESSTPTFGDLLNSEFFGMWRDRADIADSAEFAGKLRAESWKRPPDEP